MFWWQISSLSTSSSNWIWATVFCDMECTLDVCILQYWTCALSVVGLEVPVQRQWEGGLTSCGFQAGPVSVSGQVCPIYCLNMFTHIHPITRSYICIDNSQNMKYTLKLVPCYQHFHPSVHKSDGQVQITTRISKRGNLADATGLLWTPQGCISSAVDQPVLLLVRMVWWNQNILKGKQNSDSVSERAMRFSAKGN